jgi:mannose-6-phosphate isomerase-like protein (cupin superfamily)
MSESQKTMPIEAISRQTAEHYQWGTGCDGCHLVKTSDLSVIEESMPPGTSEVRHSHARARQFFYILEGEFTMEVDRQILTLRAGEGLEIAPGQPHQAMNRGSIPVRFLVISQPPSHADRVPA